MEIAIRTPLIHSLPLSQHCGCNVWLKMESSQPTGSFKLRSAGHICCYYAEKGAMAFISSSGGNAGIAVAHSGRKLGLPVTVVVPETTSVRAKQLIEQEGARLIVHGKVWSEANDFALSLATDKIICVHPFDNPLLWQGISTIVDEVISEGVRPDAVILSVGGGSMLSGIAQGLEKHQLSDIPLYAVETHGTASLNASLEAGKLVRLDKVSGIATTLAANQVCKKAFEVASKLDVRSMLVSDAEALSACRRFLDDHRVLTEPACGVSLSILYDRKIRVNPADNVLVIVCGGASVTLEGIAG
ncbi:pyridoxal-phosphate dependent enzyme [Erwinia psidii]|uniref:L-serine ammonia-lyase n=1 Tax=Erwinia psidii TaxID=69224 RepID=A0A3N6SNL4_9GAMM|nr:pyridoxal-phosphate dependent enzyme [Erwinia psidii]MCX8956343.1 pyridoxal-phosphate dependent enzyme [Erwinia psidii]MCX8959898.1 pyridoxal-phosphate dependent enzyme [Erwinia psidii]RQM39346.1 pyridoxal-phosphate dependent enzyme [Erwinia psidii]